MLTKFSLFFFSFFQINPDGLFRLTSLDGETLELKIKGNKKKSLRGPTQGFLHFPAREKKLWFSFLDFCCGKQRLFSVSETRLPFSDHCPLFFSFLFLFWGPTCAAVPGGSIMIISFRNKFRPQLLQGPTNKVVPMLLSREKNLYRISQKKIGFPEWFRKKMINCALHTLFLAASYAKKLRKPTHFLSHPLCSKVQTGFAPSIYAA